MQLALTILIVALTASWLGWRMIRSLSSKGGGCDGCGHKHEQRQTLSQIQKLQ